MRLAQTLKLQELQSTAAGTQATVPDSRSADSWIKKYLDDKNKRLNDQRVRMNSLLGPEKGELQSEGTSEGAEKGWDSRGRGRKSSSEPKALITRAGWYGKDKFYPKASNEDHQDMLHRLGIKDPNGFNGMMIAFQKGYVRITMGVSKAYLEGIDKNSFRDALANLPKAVETVELDWHEPKYNHEILSKEEAIDMYASWRADKPPVSEQDIRKAASGGAWAVVTPDGEVLSTWQTQQEAENAAYSNWKGITPSSTGATAGAKVKRVKDVQAEDVYSDPQLMEQGRKKFLKHDKPMAVKLADWLRDGDHRPSSAGKAAGGTGFGGT